MTDARALAALAAEARLEASEGDQPNEALLTRIADLLDRLAAPKGVTTGIDIGEPGGDKSFEVTGTRQPDGSLKVFSRHEIAHIEVLCDALIDAKLSPAPVEEDGTTDVRIGDRFLLEVEVLAADEDGRNSFSVSISGHTLGVPRHILKHELLAGKRVPVAPTPPAEGSDGGELGRWLARMNAPDDMLIYRRAGDGASISLGALRATADRIADLEARLAEEKAKHALTIQHAESALTDARKRIGALEAGLRQMIEHYVSLAGCGDCGIWDPEKEPEVIAARALLTAPASPETPEGQEKADG